MEHVVITLSHMQSEKCTTFGLCACGHFDGSCEDAFAAQCGQCWVKRELLPPQNCSSRSHLMVPVVCAVYIMWA